MAEAIYTLKMYLLQTQLKISQQEVTGLRRMSIFISLIYTKVGLEAPLTVAAPNNDLKLLKVLVEYAKIDPELSAAVIDKFSHHLWYLSGELVCLAFFDEQVDLKTKTAMVKNLQRSDDTPRTVPAVVDNNKISKLTLPSFVSIKSKSFF